MNKLLAGILMIAFLAGSTATAAATTDPSDPSEPVTITLSPEQVRNLCEKRLPKIERRATRLLDRIQGDATVRGSVEWLRARATSERDAGRESSAQLLEERADRRAGRVDQLTQVGQWVTTFRTEHCESR
jgi:propanediol dehydratase small subunit